MSNRFSNNKVIKIYENTLVGANGSLTSAWFPCASYAYIALNLANSAALGSYAKVQFSFDKVNIAGVETVIPDNTEQYKSASTRVKAPYFRVYVKNNDAAQKNMTVTAFLND